MAILSLPVAELNAFDLPATCLVTGAEAEVSFRKVKFAWSPRWVPLLILVPYGGLLLAVVVSLVLRKRAAGELPFSQAGWDRYRRGVWMTYAALPSLVVGLIGAIVLFTNQRFELGLGVAVLGVVGTMALHVGGNSLGLAVQKITVSHLELRIPSEAVAQRFRQHLEAAAPAPAPTAVAV